MPTPYSTTAEQHAYDVAWATYRAFQQAEVAAVGTAAFPRLNALTTDAWAAVQTASAARAAVGDTATETRLHRQRLAA